MATNITGCKQHEQLHETVRSAVQIYRNRYKLSVKSSKNYHNHLS